MIALAARMVRYRWGSAVATLVALASGVALLMSLGTFVESGLRYRAEPHRYAAADVVLARSEIVRTVEEFDGESTTSTVRLPGGGAVPERLVANVGKLPGVESVVGDTAIPVFAGSVPSLGHGWSSAALGRYGLTTGVRPSADNEIVIGSTLSDAGLRPGESVDLLIGGVLHRFTVTGVVDDADAVFFTDATAAALNPTPGHVAAVGVRAAPDADRDALVAALTTLADEVGARAYTGDDRGLAEPSAELEAQGLLIQLGGAFGGYVVLLILFVVAGTVGLAVRHRRRDLALLRAIAATPGQVRRMILAEAALLGGLGAVLGLPLGVLATRWARGELVDRGFAPESFPILPGAVAAPTAVLLTSLVAIVAALVAARRVTKIRPTEALGEVAVEPVRGGRVRRVFGLVMLAAATSLGPLTLGTGGLVAMSSATGMLYLFVLAVGLLAPEINRFAARLLDPLLRTLWRSSGYLAAANLRANARGTATVLTALVLAVGLGGSVWFLQDNLERNTVDQRRDGTLAQRALVSDAGLPATAVDEIRRVPGVEAATPVRSTTVVAPVLDGIEAAGAQAVDPATLPATVDLDVTDGSLDALDERTVAVSDLRASSSGWGVGDTANLHLADGTPVELRVVAIYRRGLGFGDFTLAAATVGGPADQVLIRTAPGADTDRALAAVAARYPGSALVQRDDLTAGLARDLAVSAWANKLLISVLVGYAALAAANTMVVAALARRRELAVLRLVGLTKGQVKRMVHAEQAGLLGVALVIGGVIAAWTLASVVRALTGDLVPYVPPLGGAAVIGGATLLALLTTVLPIGRLLRTPPVEHIGVKE
ncbi:ABC transporter permease [Cryptosporangium aurantiacum]|uniref:Putative ABC transport system permease protein n=1 Tax=Cryptosporangium aurantiacum TaxID=134849 RepID=A0A1M7RM96_9ACTN|nr:ABC transporter permease [Cryptosporangium aurantiacum]SHN47216.1 putative ABC transport system permease protein [Cryptosporangium aurantiacum]